MSAADTQEQLDVLVELGQRMLKSAETADWETVSHLHQMSLKLAGELFDDVIAATDVRAVSKAVNEVLRINKCIEEMSREARDLCLDEMDQFRQGRRAVREYSANTP